MATFRTRDGRTQARVTVDGVQVARTFRTRTEAKLWASHAETDSSRGEFIDPKAGTVTFANFADAWVTRRDLDKAPSTVARDRSYLKSLILPTFGRRAVANITTPEIEDWVAALNASDATRAKALQIVSNVLERARLSRAIVTNPAKDVSNRPSPATTKRPARILNDSELERLLATVESIDIGRATASREPRAFAVVAMGRLALRSGEALGLRIGDFDPVGRLLTVERSRDKDGTLRPLKGRNASDHRTIPVPNDVWSAYERHTGRLRVRPISGDLFVTQTATPLVYSNWRARSFATAVRAASLEGLVSHDLRKTAITRLFTNDSWTPAEVQAFVGHRDARVTLDIYAQVNSAELPRPSVLAGELSFD